MQRPIGNTDSIRSTELHMDTIHEPECIHRFECYGQPIEYHQLHGNRHRCQRLQRYGPGNGNDQSSSRGNGQHTGSSMQRAAGNADGIRGTELHMDTFYEPECIHRFIGDS